MRQSLAASFVRPRGQHRPTSRPRVGRDESARVDLRLSLQAALRQLAPKQRAVVVLRYLEDLPDAQIAESSAASPARCAVSYPAHWSACGRSAQNLITDCEGERSMNTGLDYELRAALDDLVDVAPPSGIAAVPSGVACAVVGLSRAGSTLGRFADGRARGVRR